MAAWTTASVAYFLYVSAVALVLRSRSPRSRSLACGGSALGIALALAGGWSGMPYWIAHGGLPIATLLVAYWTTGTLWTGAMPRIEAILRAADESLGIPRLASGLPRALVEALELAYVGVYPLIPAALLLHLVFSPTPEADRFWTVILVTDFVCFGMLPWIQTRPPRAIERGSPWRSSLRTLNLGVVERLSIGANTVPSGHAAEAVAVALLLTDAGAPIALAMWTMAAAISAGAVFGRYHYALDAVAGWIIAVLVWLGFG